MASEFDGKVREAITHLYSGLLSNARFDLHTLVSVGDGAVILADARALLAAAIDERRHGYAGMVDAYRTAAIQRLSMLVDPMGL